MEIIINSKNVNPNEEQKALIEKKLQRISRHFSPDATAEVMLGEEKPGLVKFEVCIRSGAKTFRAEEVNSDIRFCLDRVLDKLKAQMEKTRNRRGTEVPTLIEEPI